MNPVHVPWTPIVYEDLHHPHTSCIQVHKIRRNHHLGVITHFYQRAHACAIIMISNSSSYVPELDHQLIGLKSSAHLNIPVFLVSKSNAKNLARLFERRSHKLLCEISPVSTSHLEEVPFAPPCEPSHGKQALK